MSDPPRYVEVEPIPELRAVLGSAAEDRPPPGSRARALAALGVGLAGTAVAGSAVATGTVATGATGAKASLPITLFLKLSASIVLVAGVAGTAVHFSRVPERAAPVAAPSSSVAPPAAAAAPIPPAEMDLTPPPPPSAQIAPVPPSIAVPRTRVAPSHAASPSVVGPSSSVGGGSARGSLADETEALARANAAVRRGERVAAERSLDAYDKRFGRTGALAVEAESLRVEAVAIDDRGAARAMAREFVRRHPESPLGARLLRSTEAAAP